MEKTEKILAAAKAAQETYPGVLGLGFYDFESGESCYLQEHTVFPTASMVKIFFLHELFRQAEQGMVDLEARTEIAPGTAAKGSGVISRLKHSVSLTLHDHAVLMMQFSDNTSTDVVLEAIGRENLRKNLFAALAMEDTFVGETQKDPEDKRRMGYYNTRTDSSPADTVKVLRSLHDATLMEKASCEDALSIMQPRPPQTQLQKYLPREVTVRRKSGSVSQVVNDAGIISTEKGEYALVILCNAKGVAPEVLDDPKSNKASEMLSRLSETIYNIYMED